MCSGFEVQNLGPKHFCHSLQILELGALLNIDNYITVQYTPSYYYVCRYQFVVKRLVSARLKRMMKIYMVQKTCPTMTLLLGDRLQSRKRNGSRTLVKMYLLFFLVPLALSIMRNWPIEPKTSVGGPSTRWSNDLVKFWRKLLDDDDNLGRISSSGRLLTDIVMMISIT